MTHFDADLVYAGDPVHWTLDNALLPDLDPWQKDALRSSSRQSVWLVCRQAGKSTIAALKALHKSIYDPGLILLVSPSLRQSGELYKKFVSFYEMVDNPRPPRMIKSTELTCELENGSRVVSLPDSETTVRGYSSVSLIIEDEASRISDDLHFSVMPMLAISQGQLLMMATPAGRRGAFYNQWISDAVGWEKIRIVATDCPRISKEFLKQEKRSMPPYFFNQEYFCTWADSINQVFSEDLISRLFTHNPDLKPLFPQDQDPDIDEMDEFGIDSEILDPPGRDPLLSSSVKTFAVMEREALKAEATRRI